MVYGLITVGAVDTLCVVFFLMRCTVVGGRSAMQGVLSGKIWHSDVLCVVA